MFDKVKTILEIYTESEINENSSLVGDLGLSSFDLVSIVAKFEDEFNIKVADEDIMDFITVKDIMNYLKKKCK